MILDKRKIFSCGSGETLSENLYFSQNFYKFISGFPRFFVVLIG
jgi:hypothetical protein